ncbi:MAG TPA: GAF domain-containing protein [Polyangiales bacterium]|nr:GAF domain-containing protein [Polyangiales bacterium]
MGVGLVEQLVSAGLVTAAQASASHAGDPLVPSGRVLRNLVTAGLDERVLAGFFISRGFGPMLQEQDLRRADQELVRRLPASDAHDLCAMPLRPSPAGAIVAMADPTDAHAVARLGEALGGSILPTVAKLSDLLASIDRAYPPDRPTLVSDPLALARSRIPSDAFALTHEKSEVGSQPTLSEFDPAFSGLASTASPVWDRAWHHSTTEREVPLPSISHSPQRPATPGPAPASESNIELRLHELTQATSRDEVARLACEACLTAAQGAAFLALRKGVFRGWDGAGDEVTSASIRSLWVPASNPSVLNEVLHTGRPFRGAYGQTAADHLFRAALGSRGRDVVVVPVLVGTRMVGVLCANDPAPDAAPVERVAEAMGEALERLIVSQKSGI